MASRLPCFQHQMVFIKGAAGEAGGWAALKQVGGPMTQLAPGYILVTGSDVTYMSQSHEKNVVPGRL